MLALTMGMLSFLPLSAYDFTYEYEGETLAYTVLDYEAKTCSTKAGENISTYYSPHYVPGNTVVCSTLVIPEYANDGKNDYRVVEIGEMSFLDADSIRTVRLPESIRNICYRAFFGSDNLESINIPRNVLNILKECLEECPKLKQIDVDVENINFGSFDGILYNKKTASVKRCPPAYTGTVTIPEGIKGIDSHAFYRSRKVYKLYLPASLKTISESAFEDCELIKDIYYFERIKLIEGTKYDFDLPVLGKCRLHLANKFEGKKLPRPWRYFLNIEFNDLAAINAPEAEKAEPGAKEGTMEIFRIDGTFAGHSFEALSPGLYIVRQGNAVKKVLK